MKLTGTKPPKSSCLHMKCKRCKRVAKNIPVTPYDLPGATLLVMNYCPRCDEGGGFEESWYYDKNGKEITP